MRLLEKVGLVGLGLVAGVSLSLHFAAMADRETIATPLPVEELRAFSEVFGRIKSDYVEPVTDKRLITEAINGMLNGLDPHSAYLDADAFKELQVGTQGEFGGLGIEVGMEDGLVKVISPIEDTPAYHAGLKSGDLIIKLDDSLVKGLSLNEAVKRMRGKPGSKIILTVIRKDEPKPLTFTVARAVIKVQSVKSKLIESGYAFIRITQFQEHTGENLASALESLVKQNQSSLKGVVLDLRNDPGGLLTGAVAVSAAFLAKDALVVYTEGRTEDAKMRLTAAPENYLRGSGKDDYLKKTSRLNQERTFSCIGKWRLGLGIRNCCRRIAGSQTRGHHGHSDLRKRIGADRTSARQQYGNQADNRALLHTRRSLDSGQGHRA